MEARGLFAQMAEALRHSHALDVVHRDLMPDWGDGWGAKDRGIFLRFPQRQKQFHRNIFFLSGPLSFLAAFMLEVFEVNSELVKGCANCAVRSQTSARMKAQNSDTVARIFLSLLYYTYMYTHDIITCHMSYG